MIIDIGANVGDLYQYFKLRGIEVFYLGYEPGPLEFECLSINTNLDRNQIFNIALSNETGLKNFYYEPYGANSSLIEPPFYINKIDVKVMKLKDHLSKLELSGKIIKCIKIETEGNEPEVLLGAESLLQNTQYVAVDCGFERGLDLNSTLQSIFSILYKNNFQLIASSPGGGLRFCFKNNNLI